MTIVPGNGKASKANVQCLHDILWSRKSKRGEILDVSGLV